MRRRDVALRQVVWSLHDVEVHRTRPDDPQSDFSLWVQVEEYFITGDCARLVFEWQITVLDPVTATVANIERRASSAVDAAMESISEVDPGWWIDRQDLTILEDELTSCLSYRGIEVVR